MVVPAALPVADGPPATDVTVGDRVGIGGHGGLGADRRLEAPPHDAVIGHEVVDAIFVGLETVPRRHDVHALRPSPLDGLEQVRVEADLEHRASLGLAGELRVPDLVRPGAETARARHAAQHVRPAEPAPVEERRLHDHVRPLAHGGERPLEPDVLVEIISRSRDAQALPLEVAQECSLVLVPALAQDRDVGTVKVGRASLPAGHGQVEMAQMVAGEMIGQIGGAEPQSAACLPHCPESFGVEARHSSSRSRANRGAEASSSCLK